MKELLVHFVLLFCFYSSSAAQGKDTINWFPYKAGDMWEYWVNDGVRTDTAQIINIKDSLLSNGKIRLVQYRRLINPTVHDPFLDSLNYSIDTSGKQVFQPFGEPTDPPRITNVPVYKFNVQLGDKWIMYDYRKAGGGGYEMARVKAIYEGMLFSRNTTFLLMHYYLAQDSTDTLGLSRNVVTLAKGFGLVENFPSEGGEWYRLKGAVINGVLYGDTTRVITSVYDPWDGLPANFELQQNYPNPLNPLTAIKYSIPQRTFIRLVVYDVLGKEVRTLIEDVQEAGCFNVLFDAAALPNGIYFYRLTAGGYTGVGKMILLR